MPAGEFHALMEQGHVVIDLRDQIAFGGAHIPGAFGLGVGHEPVGLGGVGRALRSPPAARGGRTSQTPEAARALVRVGLDDIRGHLAGRHAGVDSRRATRVAVLKQESPAELLSKLSREPRLQVARRAHGR